VIWSRLSDNDHVIADLLRGTPMQIPSVASQLKAQLIQQTKPQSTKPQTSSPTPVTETGEPSPSDKGNAIDTKA
jgi:hypothetical protein